MDIKIKKEDSVDRKLDIPNFKSSHEINREFDQIEFEEHPVSPKDTVRLEKHEDDLELTTQMITTELNTDSFNTLEVDTIDIENDLKVIESEQEASDEKRDEDTIKMNKPKYVELDGDDEAPIKREFNINIKFLYIGIALIILIAVIVSSVSIYRHATSQERFISEALETTFPITDIEVYGESVNVIAPKSVKSVQLYNLDTEQYTNLTVGQNIDQQLHFSSVASGEYLMFINDKIATVDSSLDVSYQTITRDGKNKDVSFTTNDDGSLEVKVVDSTKQQTDILIDASQGEVQGFTASDGTTTEQALSLKYALSLKSNLQQLGYNVEVTRDSDEVPGDCNYKDTYCATGRVAMAYENDPKLYIQLGFNGEGGSGFEITDSNLNSHTLARILKSSLSSSLTPSERVSGQLESGLYNKTYDDADGNTVDYLYLIRETGGIIMGSDNEDASDFNTQKVGTEAIAIDLGYMSEEEDFNKLNDDSEIDTITKSIASGIDQYIKQY